MKKHVLLATGLAVLSTSAFATKSRMAALGQNTDRGSFYIEDTRNVFRNASALNNTKNYLVTEWGDSNASETVEGGFFREMGSFAYGLYLGDEANGTFDRSNSNFLKQDNNLDLMFAGDMGVKWGARLHYTSSEDESGAFKKENDGLGLGLGIEMGAIEVYANLDLKDESKGAATADDKFEGDGMVLGASYNMGAMTFFADYETNTKEETVSGTKTETDYTAMTVGVGHIHEVTSTARVFTDIAYATTETEVKGGTKTETTALPLTVGFESDATSWLTLRGSVKQNVIINETKTDGKKKSTNNTTDVAAGATLNFGKLKVDGVIGTDGSGNENGNLRTDALMSKVAVHYWF
ncbi:hypothetical protein HBN50_05835 [Halobacteriovorax sp. GB3]|uniref:hypothetical protein n=1 Tax=Halobacteriovorax sp. GB3 TaxID=2719615 RepID=UPI0023623A09|nr:hypothetical protein [Halobacteriovorax sp. GB3]MDD0852606.1 hypothetical protein [Halobacteriovorax sp. GB3]